MGDLPKLDNWHRERFGTSHSYAVGTVIGVHALAEPTCDVEVVILSRHGTGFRVRHLVLGHEQLAQVRSELFHTEPAPTWPHTDTDVPTLEDAYALAADIARRSTAHPVRKLHRWRSSTGDEAFEKFLTSYRLRTAIDVIPSPALWLRATRGIGRTIGWVLSVGLMLLAFGSQVLDPFGRNGATPIDLLLGGVVVVAVMAAVGGIAMLVDYVGERRAAGSAAGRHRGAG